MSYLDLQKITKIYKKTKVVDNLSLTVDLGESVVLVGPSGSGKTTILKIIAGLTKVTAGCLFIDGKDAKDLRPRDREIGMVFQNYALYPHMNAYDNIAFGMDQGQKSNLRDDVFEVADLLKITDCLSQKPGKLSGGQQQRVAIARAIARKPKLLLMDEPLSNLDAHLRNQMRAELNTLRNRLATTFIYVTHDQTEAMTLSNRIVVLNQGRVEQIGTPVAIYKKPQNLFTASFMGNPPMNFFKLLLKEKDQKIVFLLLGLVLNLPQAIQKRISRLEDPFREVIMGIRPEDICFCQSPEEALLAEVEWVEWLGSESILHLKLEETRFIMRKSGKVFLKKGEKALITFDLSKIHLFNKNGERWL